MTQLMLDFAPVAAPVCFAATRETKRSYRSQPAAIVSSTRRSAPLPALPLYDAQQGELKSIGDLAQAVIGRYEIVRIRRAARLRREAARAATCG